MTKRLREVESAPLSRQDALRAQMIAGPEKQKRKLPKRSPASALRARQEAERLIQENGHGDWSIVGPRLLVGFYLALHLKVYGVDAEDVGEAWVVVLASAKRMFDAPPFAGDSNKAIDYMRWLWRREKHAEEHARTTDRRRLSWKLCFCTRAIVVDWLKVQKASER